MSDSTDEIMRRFEARTADAATKPRPKFPPPPAKRPPSDETLDPELRRLLMTSARMAVQLAEQEYGEGTPEHLALMTLAGFAAQRAR